MMLNDMDLAMVVGGYAFSHGSCGEYGVTFLESGTHVCWGDPEISCPEADA